MICGQAYAFSYCKLLPNPTPKYIPPLTTFTAPPAESVTAGASHLSTMPTSGGPVLSPQDREAVVLKRGDGG